MRRKKGIANETTEKHKPTRSSTKRTTCLTAFSYKICCRKMPRNAAKNLSNNNKRTCLPVVTQLRATTNTTATAATVNNTQGATEAIEYVSVKKTITGFPHITEGAATTSFANRQPVSYDIFEIVELNEGRTSPDANTIAEQIIVINDGASDETPQYLSNSSTPVKYGDLFLPLQDNRNAETNYIEEPNRESQRKTPSSLYPLVIELKDQCVPSVSSKAVSSTTPTISKGSKSHTVPSPIRLASLRIRRTPTIIVGSTSTVSNSNKSPTTTSVAVRLKRICSANAKQIHTTAAAWTCSIQSLQQQHPHRKGELPSSVQQLSNSKAEGAAKSQEIKKNYSHLDAEILNRIVVLDSEVQKSGSGHKRKRTHSATTLSLRCRSSTRKNSSSSAGGGPICNNIHDKSYLTDYSTEGVTTDAIAPLQVFSNSPIKNNNSNVNNNHKTSPGNSNSKKRGRVMSLYERHYLNDDGGRSGSGATGSSNGYLNASSSRALAHGNGDANNQDTGQEREYYHHLSSSGIGGIATSNVSSLSSSSALNNIGGGSLNAINHAPSMATLCNIGNTCYLNSVVYTLRFAPQFLHNLHHLVVDLNSVQQNMVRYRGGNVSNNSSTIVGSKTSSLSRGLSASIVHGNDNNSNRHWSGGKEAPGALGIEPNTGSLPQKSSHQLVTERLHDLYQSLHRNEATESTDPFHADTLLHAIQDVSAIFEGNQQQDAHEFLMCLLNSVRETCQTLIKAIGDCPDLITNGYMSHSDELDAYSPHERDGTPSSGISSSTSSSLSTSKGPSFFLRKSKRKEEAKNLKNVRLQSPLKDAATASLVNAAQQQQSLPVASNSLFYLNTVDLTGGIVAATPSPIPSASTTASIISGDQQEDCNNPNGLKASKERLAERIRELGVDFFSEDFEGVTVSTTKCLSCETVTEQKESMIDIAVPVPIAGYDCGIDQPDKSGSGGTSSFIQSSCITREYFRAENKYRCEQCTGYTEAIRSISYEVLPRLLVIQLSRFSGGMEKINSYIPTAFTLQCFCSKCCELSEAHKLHVYRLYSVITHVGATMSVGHYIAYTCSLDWANEYINCPKERDRQRAAAQHKQATGVGVVQTTTECSSVMNPQQPQQLNNGASASSSSAASAAASALAASSSSLIKKMKFGRSKASSSGDMSKNLKTLNGLTTTNNINSSSKGITNGIGRLSMNTTCPGLGCCATRVCSVQHQQKQQQTAHHHYMPSSVGGSSSSEVMTEEMTNSGGYGSTGRSSSRTMYTGSYLASASSSTMALSAGGSLGGERGEPIWYMCDDDKIKAMSQREFEELLSPTRKITITPYLLFYARFDLQPTTSTTVTSSSGKQAASSPHTSWSNESLDNGASKI